MGRQKRLFVNTGLHPHLLGGGEGGHDAGAEEALDLLLPAQCWQEWGHCKATCYHSNFIPSWNGVARAGREGQAAQALPRCAPAPAEMAAAWLAHKGAATAAALRPPAGPTSLTHSPQPLTLASHPPILPHFKRIPIHQQPRIPITAGPTSPASSAPSWWQTPAPAGGEGGAGGGPAAVGSMLRQCRRRGCTAGGLASTDGRCLSAATVVHGPGR